jgi:hypothetical protein
MDKLKKILSLSFRGMNISDKKEREIINTFEAIYKVKKLKVK